MPARKNLVPSYLLHKQSGRARVVWTDPATGLRRSRLLPGPCGSPESRQAYRRLLLELETNPTAKPDPDRVSLAEVLLAFLKYAELRFRDDEGKPTSELRSYRLVVGTLRDYHETTPAAEFGPLALKAIRSVWVKGELSRGEVNRRAGMVRRIFKWAAAEELIAFDAFHRLTAVEGLRQGRTTAHETEPIRPVAGELVEATLPYLNAQVLGLVEFMRHTGCRPGEAGRLRWEDVDASGAVWLFRPKRHKNAHRGKARVIAIGPRAQELLRQLPQVAAGEYLFSPARSVADRLARRSLERQTPRYPSHMARNASKRLAQVKHPAADRYTARAVRQAILRAVEKANRVRLAERVECGPNRPPLAAWHPNQLRHSHGTTVRKLYGLEAAQVVLGHARADVTQVYAETNVALAAKVAAEIG